MPRRGSSPAASSSSSETEDESGLAGRLANESSARKRPARSRGAIKEPATPPARATRGAAKLAASGRKQREEERTEGSSTEDESAAATSAAAAAASPARRSARSGAAAAKKGARAATEAESKPASPAPASSRARRAAARAAAPGSPSASPARASRARGAASERPPAKRRRLRRNAGGGDDDDEDEEDEKDEEATGGGGDAPEAAPAPPAEPSPPPPAARRRGAAAAAAAVATKRRGGKKASAGSEDGEGGSGEGSAASSPAPQLSFVRALRSPAKRQAAAAPAPAAAPAWVIELSSSSSGDEVADDSEAEEAEEEEEEKKPRAPAAPPAAAAAPGPAATTTIEALWRRAAARRPAGPPPAPAPPPPPSSSSSSASALRGAAHARPWVEAHAPRVEDDLAVHRRKRAYKLLVAEVKEWLERNAGPLRAGDPRAQRLLVLAGPPGAGKTATVRVLAAAMGYELAEYAAPAGTHWQPRDDASWRDPDAVSVPYEARVPSFRDFLLRSHKYALSFGPGPAAPRLLLVEEFPQLPDPGTQEAFHSAVREFLASARSPAVFVVSTEGSAPDRDGAGAGSSGRRGPSFDRLASLVPRDVQSSPLASVIHFNPIAPTLLTKALERVAAAEGVLGLPEAAAAVEAARDGGDVRSAIHALQGWRPRAGPGRPRRRLGAGRGRGPAEGALRDGEAAGVPPAGRDVMYSLLHALGKVLHCKRAPAPPGAPPGPGDAPPRGPPDFDVNRLLERLPASTSAVIAFLHQNYPPFFEEPDDFAEAADALAEADVLSRFALSYGGGAGVSQAAAYAAPLAVRGVMAANWHPARPKFQPITGPRVFANDRAARETAAAVRAAVATSEDLLGAGSAAPGPAPPPPVLLEPSALALDLLPYAALVAARRPAPVPPPLRDLLRRLASYGFTRFPHGAGGAPAPAWRRRAEEEAEEGEGAGLRAPPDPAEDGEAEAEAAEAPPEAPPEAAGPAADQSEAVPRAAGAAGGPRSRAAGVEEDEVEDADD
eukprot:tig00000455_g1040.t1